MTTNQNSKVRGGTRELLTALRDLLGDPATADADALRRSVNIASGYLDALLTIEGATLAAAAENIRKQALELNGTTDR